MSAHGRDKQRERQRQQNIARRQMEGSRVATTGGVCCCLAVPVAARYTLCTCWPAPLQTAKSKALGKEAVKGRGKEPVRGRGKEPVRGRGKEPVRGRGKEPARGRGKRGPRAQDEDELAELAEGARLLKKFKAGKVPSLNNVCVCVCA